MFEFVKKCLLCTKKLYKHLLKCGLNLWIFFPTSVFPKGIFFPPNHLLL